MRVTLEIHENYGNVLTLTAIGLNSDATDVTTAAVDLSKHDYVTIDKNGKVKCMTASEY
jgi:hypothetical protein